MNAASEEDLEAPPAAVEITWQQYQARNTYVWNKICDPHEEQKCCQVMKFDGEQHVNIASHIWI